MDKSMFLDTVFRWSPEFVKGCLSTYEEHICTSAGFYILSALILLVSCSLLLYHRCSVKTRSKNWGDEAVCALYCFVGNLCSAVGAFLSNQFDFQISMASYMAIMDVVNFLSISFSMYLWFKSRTGRKMRMISRRRRQNFLAVCLLFIMAGSVYLGLPVRSIPVRASPTMRRLFGMFLNDHTENLGYVLGLLAFAISWTSKFPFILKANRGEQGSAVLVSSRLLSSVAGALYGSAILLYDTQLKSVIKTMPWILSAICGSILDLSIVVLVCYRSSHKRPSVRSLDSDTESLLGEPSVTGQLCNNNECCRKKHHLSTARGISPKGTDMGLYMDVNIQPMRKVCLKEVTISRDGSSESLPLKRTVRVVRVDEHCSCGSSTDSSSLDSELEWDFGETKSQWTPVEEAPEDLQKVMPLQEWSVGSSGRLGSHVCFCNRAQLAEKLASK
ncbi:transmembrane protein 44 [Danio rerio]|uniref:Transmembrane protein 44 n=3 Tax=Danio rerio TaxID=7955 RepID=F6P1P1_DANRE|nr:transmembrane protein 44 isoform X2 [Danio rerio]|eukprot:XP_005169458.1 transmembrane protein 44 isoform X2 [Danio rerio]